MSKNRERHNPSRPIHSAVAAEADEEEFGGGEPVCWLALLDDDGDMPDQPRSHAVHAPAVHPTTAALSGDAAQGPISVHAPSPTSALTP
jgi:hypothetical protein